MADALLFLTAFAIAACRCLRQGPAGRWHWVIAGLGLLCFLEEIGFGIRLAGLPMLNIDGFGVDGLHDFLHLLKIRAVKYLTYGLIAMGLALAVYWRQAIGERLSQIAATSAGRYAFCFFGLVALALWVDYAERYPSAYEELLELDAALALTFAAAAQEKREEPAVRVRKIAA